MTSRTLTVLEPFQHQLACGVEVPAPVRLGRGAVAGPQQRRISAACRTA